ncbi:MAG: hypothetical protein COA79_14005 [Planctomycetota bacterium]|nr:MAG: hypothetical protein COA79_14005 [Planctomycetota bacterium]
MKYLFIIIFSTLIIACGSKVINLDVDLEEKEEFIYKKGTKEKFTGTAFRYDKKTKKKIGKYQLINGLFSGPTTYWYPSGKKKGQVSFVKGKREGKEVQWYEDGKKKGEADVVNGKVHGKFIRWFKNGKKHQEIYFVEGKAHGKSMQWYENEKQEFIKTYKSGTIESEEHWNKDGSEKKIKPKEKSDEAVKKGSGDNFILKDMEIK